MENKEKVLDKIQKLLAKADTTANSNLHEVEVASLKAQELMAKHNITLSEVGLENKEEIIHGNLDITKHRSWKINLAMMIAENFRCEVYFNEVRNNRRLTKQSVIFIGHEVDVRIANEMYQFLYKIGDKNANRAVRRSMRDYGTSKGTYNSYTKGFVSGLREKFEENCRALALVIPPEVVEEKNNVDIIGKVRSRAVKESEFDSNAYAVGFSDGKSQSNGSADIENRERK